MKATTLSAYLKAITVFTGLCGTFLCFYWLPHMGSSLIADSPELEPYYLPWLGLLIFISIPCYAILVLAWNIFTNIGKNHSFSTRNAKMLKWISILILGDVLFFFFMNILYLFLNINHPGVVLLSLFIVFIGFCLSVMSAALSYLTSRAAELQEFNDSAI